MATTTGIPERIANGVLTGAGEVKAIYTVPRHTRVVLSSIVLTNASAETVNVGAFVTVGAATSDAPDAVPIMPPQLELGPGDSYHLTTPIAIEANEFLMLYAKMANAIRYYVSAIKVGSIPSASDRGT